MKSLVIKSVNDKEFAQYGRVVEGIEFSRLLDKLKNTTPAPADEVIYVPGDSNLESMPEAELHQQQYIPAVCRSNWVL